jgi:hypothetical protein
MHFEIHETIHAFMCFEKFMSMAGSHHHTRTELLSPDVRQTFLDSLEFRRRTRKTGCFPIHGVTVVG